MFSPTNPGANNSKAPLFRETVVANQNPCREVKFLRKRGFRGTAQDILNLYLKQLFSFSEKSLLFFPIMHKSTEIQDCLPFILKPLLNLPVSRRETSFPNHPKDIKLYLDEKGCYFKRRLSSYLSSLKPAPSPHYLLTTLLRINTNKPKCFECLQRNLWTNCGSFQDVQSNVNHL